MKKTLALLLALLMFATVFTGCGDDGRGAVIPVYISDEIVNLDPAFAYDNEASLKILPLLYEGLTTINEKGKVENALMEDYTYEQDEDGTYVMSVTLNESYWSDGITVSADDFVYAYKRILDPEFDCPAASLLYELKNARQVKEGEVSIDDLGVRSAEKTLLQFVFDHDIDEEAWLETLASPMLVPLRESAVSTQSPQKEVKAEDGSIAEFDIPAYAWSTNPASLVTNGKFCVKKLTASFDGDDGEMLLERNMYYRRDPKGSDKEDKYVKVYQLKIVYPGSDNMSQYSVGEGEVSVSLKQLASYVNFDSGVANSNIAYHSDISMMPEATAKETVDMLSQHVYYFNTNNELFKDARVRRALSMAIDRNAITELVSYTVASEGLVVNGVYADGERKTTYREKYDSLISSSADMNGAKSLLKEAGVSGGSFSLTCRKSDVDVAIANYVAGVWEELGFDVSVRALSTSDTQGLEGTRVNDYKVYRDKATNALLYGDFDVLALDNNAMSTYAFSALAPYATGFTGRAINLRLANHDENYESSVPHVTGWQNDEYDALIEKAFAEKDLGARSDILYEAEKLLMQEMPVMPLVRYQNAYVKTNDLSKLENDYYGTVYFDAAKLKNADEYYVAEE